MDYILLKPILLLPKAEPHAINNSSSSSHQPPQLLHGALGNWAVVCYGINICSTICSCLVISGTLLLLFKNRPLLNRPSLRISTSIAACDTIYSVCQMFVFNNSFMKQLPEINLRVMLWLMAASSVAFVFLSSCMGIHLILTVLTKKAHWANRIQFWYEPVSFFLALLITHPYLYMFHSVVWIESAQLFYLQDTVSVSRRNVWLIQWMWIFMGIVFLFFIAVFTYLKMSQVWTATPENSQPNGGGGPTKQAISEERKKYVRSVTFRVTCYPVIPILTQTMLVVGNLMEAPPYWIFVLGYLLPSCQGTLNFLVYLMNPALDIYRTAIVDFILCVNRRRRRRNTKSEQIFNILEEKIAMENDSESTYYLPTSVAKPSSTYSTDKDSYYIDYKYTFR